MIEFLAAHGLEQYASLFAENEVDMATLQILTDADLKELGLPFGPRKRLLSALLDLVLPQLLSDSSNGDVSSGEYSSSVLPLKYRNRRRDRRRDRCCLVLCDTLYSVIKWHIVLRMEDKLKGSPTISSSGTADGLNGKRKRES